MRCMPYVAEKMKIYGYKNEGLNPENIEPSELAEITLVANAYELKKMQNLLSQRQKGWKD